MQRARRLQCAVLLDVRGSGSAGNGEYLLLNKRV